MRHRDIQLAGDGVRVNAGDIFARVGIFSARAVVGDVEVEQAGCVGCHHVPAPDFGVRYVIGHGSRRRKIHGGGDVIFRVGVEIAGFELQRVVGEQQIVKTQPKTELLGFVSFRAQVRVRHPVVGVEAADREVLRVVIHLAHRWRAEGLSVRAEQHQPVGRTHG